MGKQITSTPGTRKNARGGKSDAMVTQVAVRMYRHGLGDCFLLKFERRRGEAITMLIDCGVLVGTKNAAATMQNVAADIRSHLRKEKNTTPYLDVVAVTHEHADHVSGFLQAKEVFAQIEIGNVWLAWTEDPHNALANGLRKQRNERISALKEAKKQLVSRPALSKGVDSLLAFFNLGAAGGGSTRDALDYIAGRATPTFCHPGDAPRTIPGLDGVRFYVFGPPEDERLLKRSNPTKKGSEVYEMALNLSTEESFLSALRRDQKSRRPSGAGAADEAYWEDVERIVSPFEPMFGITSDVARTDDPFFQQTYSPNNAWRGIDDDWVEMAGELALALDSDTNNTSLVLAIELVASGKVLLFAADAQVGNWLSWQNCSWTVKDDDGHGRTITANDLLARTVLYKVGHHGSHNATLREKGLELMTHRDLVAMIPVDIAMAKKKQWAMPFPSLKARLDEKTRQRVLIADRTVQPPSRSLRPPAFSGDEWNAFCDRLAASSEMAIEYVIHAE